MKDEENPLVDFGNGLFGNFHAPADLGILAAAPRDARPAASARAGDAVPARGADDPAEVFAGDARRGFADR